jgi:phage terminase large subunit-like protein
MTLKSQTPDLTITRLRAEPIVALYEQGKIQHLGGFDMLEDQMCNFNTSSGSKSPSGGNASGKSPDRLDALVWAFTALMLDKTGAPTVRSL